MSSPIDALQRRLHDVQTFQIPRLRACRASAAIHADLASELRHDLEGIRRRLAVEREACLNLLGSTSRPSDDMQRLEALQQEYQQAKIQYREALLMSKRAITERDDSRYELRDGATAVRSAPGEQNEEDRGAGDDGYGNAGEDEVRTKSNEVTDALRRTTQIMQAELERSVLSVQMLESSTETLRSTQTLYTTYTSLLDSSAALVKALERADWYDRLLIAAAFLFFLLVVGWVLKRRVLDRVAGGVGWWVGGSARLVKKGLGLGGGTRGGTASAGAGAGAEASVHGAAMVSGTGTGAVAGGGWVGAGTARATAGAGASALAHVSQAAAATAEAAGRHGPGHVVRDPGML